jgi:2'-5' RNA ligase
MRLFISINVPEAFYFYCERLQASFPDLKKTREFHLTIQFLGNDLGEADAKTITESLKTIKFNSFEIEIADIAPFPDAFQPRGIWIECEPSAVLLKLGDEIREKMEELGYPNDHPFRPHITLGRYKKIPSSKPSTIKGERHRFKVDQFHLMESQLGPLDSEYKILSSFS